MATPTAEPPDFFTVEEAARVLRIGRTAAYELARTWRTTSGREGLPVVAFGRLLRVPRVALEEMCGGPITKSGALLLRVPTRREAEPVVQPPVIVRVEPVRSSKRRNSRTRSASPDQTSFPFT